MNSSRKYTAWLVGLLVLPAKTFAFGAILQYEGEVDDRVAYFADLRYVLNKTPPGQTGGRSRSGSLLSQRSTKAATSPSSFR